MRRVGREDLVLTSAGRPRLPVLPRRVARAREARLLRDGCGDREAARGGAAASPRAADKGAERAGEQMVVQSGDGPVGRGPAGDRRGARRTGYWLVSVLRVRPPESRRRRAAPWPLSLMTG